MSKRLKSEYRNYWNWIAKKMETRSPFWMRKMSLKS